MQLKVDIFTMNVLAPRCRAIFSKICRCAYWWEWSSVEEWFLFGEKPTSYLLMLHS